MNRRLALSIGLGTLLAGPLALAQQEVTIGYSGLPYKSTGESNTGVQLSDGVLLHAGVGAEAGYDSNVLYSNTNVKSSGIVRVLPYAEITNATRNGPASSMLTFDIRGGLQYRHYTSTDPIVKKYSDAWNPNAGLSIGLGGSQLSFGFADIFARIEEPPYVGQVNEGPLNRSNNQGSLEMRWAPGGGRLTSILRYTNMVDVFDYPYEYANSVTNNLMLDVSWKWLPKTAIFVNLQQGYIFYLNDSVEKVNSFPLYATVGLRGLLTEKTAAALSLGYYNGFYSSGASTGGAWGSTYANLTVTVKPTALSRVVLGGRHDFLNSVISSFAYEDTAYASYVQQIAGRLALDLSGRYAHLSYQGNFVEPTQAGRVDNLFQVGASLDYFIRNWVYLGVGYSMLDNDSNLPINSYVKHQVFARLGATY